MVLPPWMKKASRAKARRRMLLASLVSTASLVPRKVGECVYRKRLEWNAHKQTLLLEGEFECCYRMDVESFENLLGFVRPVLLRDEMQSARRTDTDPFSPKNRIQMTKSWLAGSGYHATRCLAGTSRPGFYDITRDVMDALCECEELRIHSPTESLERIQELADGFTTISKSGILTGCVGCLDGWLCQIRAPSSEEVLDVAAFFSGHYQMYDLNVQAICDYLCRFTGYCFDSPRKVGDSIAFKKWMLSDEIMNLPSGFYLVGDNAYPLSDSLLVPHNKLKIKAKKHSDFNFFLSQLRIHIEMAFGLLVNKWQIFRRALVVDFKNVSKVIKTCMKLHNFCINEKLDHQDATPRADVISAAYHTLPERSYQPTDNTGEDTDLRSDARGLILRQVIVEHIQNFNLHRPGVH